MGVGFVLLQGLAAAIAMEAASPSESKPAAPETAVAKAEADEAAERKKARKSDEPTAVEGLTVQGARRGKAETPIEPELVLDEEAIRAYGATTVNELMAMLAPQLQGSRGRTGDEPQLTLINGQLTAGAEDFPIEALKELQILPEEAALAYGFRADQKVVNKVLKKNFSAKTLNSDIGGPTDGGRISRTQQGNLFKVTDVGRLNLDMRYSQSTPLFEQERDIVRASDSAPYDLQGNIVGSPSGGEIDPALSALAGSTITTAAAPASAAGGAPPLADFVGGAGRAATDDLTASRTLVPRSEDGAFKAVYSRKFGYVTATLNGGVETSSRTSFLGLPGVAVTLPAGSPFSPFAKDVTLYRYADARESLRSRTDTDKVQLGATALGMLSGWRWTVAGNFERAESDTRTGRGLDFSAFTAAVAARDPAVNPFAPISASLLRDAAVDTAHSVTTSAKADLTVVGTLAELPTGRLRATFKSGADTRRIESESLRSGVLTERTLVRDRATFQSSLDLPIAGRDAGFLPALGYVALNTNVTYEQFSDIGGLATVGGGVNWTPIKGLSFSADYSVEDGEPTPQQINEPIVLTPNIAMYDFATGQTVNVTRISGGNPDLVPDSRQVVKLGLKYKPFEKHNFNIQATYTASRIDNPIQNLPSISPELEAAFPDRFKRDATGRLTSFDVRAVNFAHADRADVFVNAVYSLTWPKPPTPPPRKPGERAVAPPPPMVKPWFIRATLTYRGKVQDEVVIREGLAPLDLLDGASLGRRGGTPRHDVTADGNVFRDGLGAYWRVNWKSSTWVDGGAGGQDLSFSDNTTVALYLFAQLGQRQKLIKRYPQLKGVGLNLGFENLFNSKQTVRDTQGRTPQAYQKDYMDPIGRTVRFSVRKQF